jgi:SAM-dependent methyltransferase
MPETEFDKHAQTYSGRIDDALSAFGKEHDYYVRVKAQLLQRMLAELAHDGKPDLLDVGCGIGLAHPHLADAVGELHGVDVSQRSLEVAASANRGVHYRHLQGERLPYESARFDCAFAICVLHHVPPAGWQAFLSEMARVVRPGGLVVIFEHNPLNPFTQWIVRTCELDEHAVLVWPGRLRSLFAGAGLGRLERRHILSTPFEGPLFRKVDRLLGRLPWGAQYYVRGYKDEGRAPAR